MGHESIMINFLELIIDFNNGLFSENLTIYVVVEPLQHFIIDLIEIIIIY